MLADGYPVTGFYKHYQNYLAFYCNEQCAAREYEYLRKESPESRFVYDPLPEDVQDRLVNH